MGMSPRYLLGLLREDANILDRLLFGGAARENPFHVAVQLCDRNLKLKTRICPRIKVTGNDQEVKRKGMVAAKMACRCESHIIETGGPKRLLKITTTFHE